MASWHYAFFFPAAGQHLQPAEAIDVLSRRGLESDETISLSVVVDDAGHLLEVGDEVFLEKPAHEDLRHRLENDEQFVAEFRNSEIIFTCGFATRSFNPHIYFGWPRKIFANLPESVQQEYWEMFRDFAKASGSAFVILVDDASDFEDRFLEIDGRRFLDAEVSHEYGHGIRAVWVDVSIGAEPPEGVSNTAVTNIGDGFREYLMT